MAPSPSVDGHLRDVVGVECVLLTQVQRRLDGVLHVDLGREPLDVKAGVDQPPRRAQAAGGNVPIEFAPEQCGRITHGRFQDLVAGGVAHAGQYGRLGAHAGGVARVGGLDHGPGVGGQPAGARGGDAQGHQGLVRVQAQGLGGGGGSPQRTHQARRVVAWRRGRRRRGPQSPLDFPTQDVGGDDAAAGNMALFRQGQGRGQAG